MQHHVFHQIQLLDSYHLISLCMFYMLDISEQISDQQSMVLMQKQPTIKKVLTVRGYRMYNFGQQLFVTLVYLPHLLVHLYQTVALVLYSVRTQMLLIIPLNCKQQSTFEIKLNQHESFLQFTAMMLS